MIVNAGDPNSKHLCFDWFFTNWCNYKCSYCYAEPDMVDSFDKQTVSSKYNLVLKRLSMLDTTFDVDILGGEPTLHTNICDVIEGLDNIANCQRIDVHTNLSRPLELYRQLIGSSDKLQIFASFHPEHYKPAFLQKCIDLKGDTFSVLVNLIDDSQYWDITEYLINQLKEAGVEYSCEILFDTATRKINYCSEWRQRFEKYIQPDKIDVDNLCRVQYDDGTEEFMTPQELKLKGLDSYTGFRCNAQMYNIGMDCEIVNRCTRKKPDIIMKVDQLKPEICSMDKCLCGQMFTFFKERV